MVGHGACGAHHGGGGTGGSAAADTRDSQYRRGMRTNALPDFRPSVHGFPFVNRWPPGPAFEIHGGYISLGIGQVADGLCGGMCFAAADRYLRGEEIPTETGVPPAGSALFHEIARRQLDSLDWLVIVPVRFWWAAMLVATGRWTPSRQAAEWRRLHADIDAGRPAMAGLVRSAGINPLRLTANHQVLGYGYEASAQAGTLRIYDPNHPGFDDVALTIRRTEEPAGRPRFSLEQTTGEPLLALLRLPYR